MRIGNFLKQSFIDWEGKITAVIFTKGCNFRCFYCHNPSLVLPEIIDNQKDIPESELFEYLNKRNNWLDGVVVSGGEPTIQPDLFDFIMKIKQLGYPVKLDTNGSNPDVLKTLLNHNLLDSIAMDIKTVLCLDKYKKITYNTDKYLIDKIKESIEIIKNAKIAHQFRTTILESHHTVELQQTLLSEFTNNHVFQIFYSGDLIQNYNFAKKDNS